MITALSQRALAYACQRVEDFALVNRTRSADEKTEATALWLEYLGLEDDRKLQLNAWLKRFMGDTGWEAAVLIGLALGLFINEYNHDHAKCE